MVNLGELREHSDYAKLLKAIDKSVDTARYRVLVASRREDIEEIRFRSGAMMALEELQSQLTEKPGVV